jgi:hypothetical protein
MSQPCRRIQAIMLMLARHELGGQRAEGRWSLDWYHTITVIMM